MLFSDFMEAALYDAEYGYYRRHAFGRSGDFYTAAQLQPVFGRFAQSLAERWLPGFENFVDVGAGQEDLRHEIRVSTYHAYHPGVDLPKTQNSVLFANEFFDALPVEIETADGPARVVWNGREFAWWPQRPVPPMRERRPALREELAKLFAATGAPAILIAIDYGYTAAEASKFASGSLMAYRSHIAHENVLDNPGEQDITAHVDWEDFFAAARESGWQRQYFQRMDRCLLECGEQRLEEWRRFDARHLKQLLFELGPRFDVAVLQKS